MEWAAAVVTFVFCWMATGLLDDVSRLLARQLICVRVKTLPAYVRAELGETWERDIAAMSGAGGLLFAVALYAAVLANGATSLMRRCLERARNRCDRFRDEWWQTARRFGPFDRIVADFEHVFTLGGLTGSAREEWL